jgi:hypothetical protein
MPYRLLLSISGIIAVATAITIARLTPESLSAIGSIVAAAGSLLAIVWFSASLWCQSRQLQEQRQQFSVQFEHLIETSRRDALLMAKSILDKAEERAIAQNGRISSITELLTEYMHFVELKPLLESTKSEEVTEAFRAWMKREGPALTLLTGVKSAAEVYLRAIGTPNIDFCKSPDEFVYMYSPHFATLPFFDAVIGTSIMLSKFMFSLAPGRNAAQLAFLAATAKSSIGGIVKSDALHAEIAKHIAHGYPLPAIAKDIQPSHPPDSHPYNRGRP